MEREKKRDSEKWRKAENGNVERETGRGTERERNLGSKKFSLFFSLNKQCHSSFDFSFSFSLIFSLFSLSSNKAYTSRPERDLIRCVSLSLCL